MYLTEHRTVCYLTQDGVKAEMEPHKENQLAEYVMFVHPVCPY